LCQELHLTAYLIEVTANKVTDETKAAAKESSKATAPGATVPFWVIGTSTSISILNLQRLRHRSQVAVVTRKEAFG